jgi:hypothetical protein
LPFWYIKASAVIENNLNVGGNVVIDGTLQATKGLNGLQQANFRWAVTSSYNQWQNWFFANNPDMWLGQHPSNWTDNCHKAWQISADKETWRTFFNKKGYAGKNAMVWADEWYSYSSTNGKMVFVMFRIKNTTQNDINWTPYFWYSSYVDWCEVASVTINGNGNWASNNNCGGSCNVSVTLSVPKNRTSTVIVSSASSPVGGATRGVQLAFYNNSLALPAGLVFIDDLDTAAGGWEQ